MVVIGLAYNSLFKPIIGLEGWVFANSPGDWGSIPSRIIPKIKKKWYLIPPCLTLSIIRYVSRVKWSNPGKGVVLSPMPRCSSYWKGSLRVTFDYSRQHYLLLYIYIYHYDVPLARINMTLGHHSLLSSIAPVRFSRLHRVSIGSRCCRPNPCSSVWRGPHENIAYEFVLTSPAVSCMSYLSNVDGFRHRW